MTQEKPKDVVSFILLQEKNLHDVESHLRGADDWYKTAQKQLDLADRNLVSIQNIEGTLDYFTEAETCLSKALGAAESARSLDKLSKEAEKTGLNAVELSNETKALNFDLLSKKSILEGIRDALSLGDWGLVSQYASEASGLWSGKEDFFSDIVVEANNHLMQPKSSRISFWLKRFTPKK